MKHLPVYEFMEFDGERVPVVVGSKQVADEEFERHIAFTRSASDSIEAQDAVEVFLRNFAKRSNLNG